jgi:DNA-binding PadR family transcriptional regulator
MGLRLRLSRQTLAVLDALLVRPTQWSHGYSISQHTGIFSGTLYPILMRLEKLGWLETRWEDARVPGRPPRHLYRLTGDGREWARDELRAALESKFWKPSYRPSPREV